MSSQIEPETKAQQSHD